MLSQEYGPGSEQPLLGGSKKKQNEEHTMLGPDYGKHPASWKSKIRAPSYLDYLVLNQAPSPESIQFHGLPG